MGAREHGSLSEVIESAVYHLYKNMVKQNDILALVGFKAAPVSRILIY